MPTEITLVVRVDRKWPRRFHAEVAAEESASCTRLGHILYDDIQRVSLLVAHCRDRFTHCFTAMVVEVDAYPVEQECVRPPSIVLV